MRLDLTSSFLIAGLAALAVLSGCSDWSALYGTQCGDELLAAGADCPRLLNENPNGPNAGGGQGGAAGESGVVPAGPTCGNGTIDEGEVCDDGNTANDDSCLSGCSRASCGDGYLREGVELCDDGNNLSGDGCTDTCLPCDNVIGSSFYNGNYNHCYKLHEEELSYEDALAVCGAEGSYLWVGTGSTEIGITKRRLFGSHEVWLGGQMLDGQLDWVTGEDFSTLPWVADEPASAACAVAFATDTKDDNVRTAGCEEVHPFVCEFRPARIDPLTHHAYRSWFVKTTHAEATDLCATKGGELLHVETEEEQNFIQGSYKHAFWTATSLDGECEYFVKGQLLSGDCEEQRFVLCEYP